MSHHLDSPSRAKTFASTSPTSMCSAVKPAPFSRSTSVIRSPAKFPTPGYHPEGMYEFKIDLDGDAVEDVTYRITFDERDAAASSVGAAPDHGALKRSIQRRPAWSSRRDHRRNRHHRVRPCASGPARRATRSGSSPTCCTRSATRSKTARLSICLRWDPAKAKNLFAGHTVYSIVLEVPDAELLATPRATTAHRRMGRDDACHRCRRMAFV